MGEMPRTKHMERDRSFHALSCHATLPKSSYMHQYGSSLKPILMGFMECSLHRHVCLHHRPSVIGLYLHPLSSPCLRGQGAEIESSSPLTTWLAPLAASSHPYAFQNVCHLHNKRHLFHLGNSKSF